MIPRFVILGCGLFLAAGFLGRAGEQGDTAVAPKLEPGLQASFTSAGAGSVSDSTVWPEVSINVPAGQAPTPFLSTSPFTLILDGFISAELRGEYQFEADLNGRVKLKINDVTVLEARGSGGRAPASELVRLGKGLNAIRAEFESPGQGDAWFRLQWRPKGGQPAPVPATALSHRLSVELNNGAVRRLGRELFLERRCLRCHTRPSGTPDPREELDAPAFEGIGSRRDRAWMAQWILNPPSQRLSARMPTIFHGPDARAAAEAAAAYLSTLQDDLPKSAPFAISAELRAAGKKLFDSLHCVGCHLSPDVNEADPQRLSLKHVARKFPSGALAAFLENPERHYAWTRMPNFKLTSEEVSGLTVFLTANADHANGGSVPPDSSVVQRGKALVQTSGCLNCHVLNLENRFAAKPLVDLSTDWSAGCLAENGAGGRAPLFGFSALERIALLNVGKTDRTPLTRSVASEDGPRLVDTLNCRVCHGKIEGVPGLERLGERLKPEWAAAFMAGQVPYRPRPWLEARMPAFPKYAKTLADGWAGIHGFSAVSAPESAVDAEAAKIGQKLVSAEGGLSCISCHAIGKTPAVQVFENAGVNLAYAPVRLHKEYFERWVRNPLAIDPVSKMPVFFDEELRSPLTDFYNGDGAKQIEAIWNYLRLGEQMPPPITPSNP